MLAAVQSPPSPRSWPMGPRVTTNFSIAAELWPLWCDIAGQHHNGRRFLLSWLAADEGYIDRAIGFLKEKTHRDWNSEVVRACGGSLKHKLVLTREEHAQLQSLRAEGESDTEALYRLLRVALSADPEPR